MAKFPHSHEDSGLRYTHYLIYGTILKAGEVAQPAAEIAGTLDFDKGGHELHGESFIMSKDAPSPQIKGGKVDLTELDAGVRILIGNIQPKHQELMLILIELLQKGDPVYLSQLTKIKAEYEKEH